MFPFIRAKIEIKIEIHTKTRIVLFYISKEKNSQNRRLNRRKRAIQIEWEWRIEGCEKEKKDSQRLPFNNAFYFVDTFEECFIDRHLIFDHLTGMNNCGVVSFTY